MNIKTYEDEDILDSHQADSEHKYEFISDLVGDNSDIFVDWTNEELLEHLRERNVIDTANAWLNGDCVYVYFNTREEARKFIGRLNEYIMHKAQLLETFQDF
jgi:hypothetical protein